MKVYMFALIACASFALLVVFAIGAFGQTQNTASLTIQVSDSNGAVVKGAKVTVTNNSTGATRNAISDNNGDATFAALPLTGTYSVMVDTAGFDKRVLEYVTLRAGETATLKASLQAAGQQAVVTVFGTDQGVRSDPQIGRRIESKQIDETPILGRKASSIPLLNSAFRQGKGTGDLFVNQTYFITGVGSRRATTFTLDGASNDEGWGRQTQIATVPVGAIQEVQVLTNAFSAEYGWTTGPAMNIVTKGGTNTLHGEGVLLSRPGFLQTDRFSTKGFCPKSVASTCVVPAALVNLSPVDIPDALTQLSGSVGGPIKKDKTFFFVTADHTWQNRTTLLSTTLPAFLLPSSGNLAWTGHYRQTLLDARLDHNLTANQSLMVRFNLDRMRDDNPQDAVGGTNAPSVARVYERGAWSTQANHTWVINPGLLNEFRFAYLHGDPVTRWLAQNQSTAYVRGSGNGAVPFTSGQSRFSDLWGHQWQITDTLSWTKGHHYIRFGGSIVRHTAGGIGNEPGAALLGTFNFLTTDPVRNKLPLDQLTLADVQNYQQPINFGVSSYNLSQWLLTGYVQDKIKVGRDLVIDAGLRYDRQTLTDAKNNFEPRVGFAWNPGGNAKTVIRGGYGMYYAQIRTNQVAGYLINGLDGITTYTATPGQVGFPACLTGACLPVNVNPANLLPSQLPQRDITIVAGKRSFYQTQFAKYGVNFAAIASLYPDKLVNPRSQVYTIGAEHEFFKGLFVGSDFVHQLYTNADRTVDLNAPTPFARTAQNQIRSVANANLTRPILPTNGGVRQVNVIMNLGTADYNGLQTQISYRGHSRINASLSYTISKATNTFEPDGNGIGPNESNITALGEQERGSSLVDQRHRVVGFFSYRFPFDITAGTLMQFASPRPFNATTGVDNNGDGINNDRPVINGVVIGKSAFLGTPTREVSAFLEKDIRFNERLSLRLRGEGFNLFNHANMLARGVTVYGNVNNVANTDFGLFVGGTGSNQLAIPAFANIDPPRMFQLQARFIF
ncbi:MAG: carboxypeptidase regulatory-like domain-containing protein [Acidobacteria bacterium]|nr:carboxypeptidase regulatory-like domain-containing protein [Acidobacteriota bacterium]